MDMVLHGFTCIGRGVAGGEQQSAGHRKVAKKAKIELPPNSMLDADWKIIIDNKVDNLVAGMAKVDFMSTSLAEIKAMFQARQHSKHRVDLLPKELVCETPTSTTQAAKQPSSNILKEMATILMPSMVTFSSTPSAL